MEKNQGQQRKHPHNQLGTVEEALYINISKLSME